MFFFKKKKGKEKESVTGTAARIIHKGVHIHTSKARNDIIGNKKTALLCRSIRKQSFVGCLGRFKPSMALGVARAARCLHTIPQHSFEMIT
jgi:hypothetical protein